MREHTHTVYCAVSLTLLASANFFLCSVLMNAGNNKGKKAKKWGHIVFHVVIHHWLIKGSLIAMSSGCTVKKKLANSETGFPLGRAGRNQEMALSCSFLCQLSNHKGLI